MSRAGWFIAAVSPELERIIFKCLENNRELRYHHASVRLNYMPTLRALFALNHGEPSKAIELL